MSDKAWQWEPEITVETSGGDGFKPYDHQTSAWDALSKHFFDKFSKAGVLVVPTGGGKTAIAARWLLMNHIAKGGRVLWFAHRRSLLRQAMHTFARAAHLAAVQKDGADTSAAKKVLRLISISSTDRSWSNVAANHDVVFSSVQSAVLEKNFGFLDLMKSQSPNGLFVVVDEAHHAASPSYQAVVKAELKERLGCPVLGLSATPVRMNPDDEKRMWNLFESVVYQIDKQTLFNKQILANPVIENVKTGVEMEKDFTADDRAHLQKFGELSDRVLDRLAKHAGRNKMIVEHYVKNRASYGPTIVFGADTLHAQTLAREFSAAGIDADYVDYSRKDSAHVMQGYADGTKPHVLVNVEMLTEGFDAPRTKTVFIARPTRSESLVAQMVGRALRGPNAGGNATAYLVTFVDTWKDFPVIETDFVVQAGEVAAPTKGAKPRLPTVSITEELVREAYRLVQSALRGTFISLHQCLPYGWFVWEQEFENDIQQRLVLVFENMRDGFEAMLADHADLEKIPATISEDMAMDLRRRYFGDAPDPQPRWPDIRALLEAKRDRLNVSFYTFDDKDKFDPVKLAKELVENNVGMQDIPGRIQSVWDANPACSLVYRNDLTAFSDAVHDALKGPPRAATAPAIVSLVPEAELRTWGPGEAGYSLVAIRDAVLAQPKHFPRGAPTIQDLTFSDRVLRAYYGYFRYSDRKLVINRVLNSPDIPRFVMEFLMFHELLHADMPSAGHNQEFRQRESRFVPSEEAVREAGTRGITSTGRADFWRVAADQFLDTLKHFFKVSQMGM